MKCKFCDNKIIGSTVYCPHCGQPIVQDSSSGGSVNDYWNKNNDIANKADSEEKAKAIRIAKERNRQRTSMIVRLGLLCAVVLVILMLVAIRNSNNEKKLSLLHESMIGQTYSDNEGSAFWLGEAIDRRVIVITDHNTLRFTEGNYTSYYNDQDQFRWRENAIYSEDTYSYEVSISFFGKMFIHFDGEKYPVNLDDEDGTVSSVDLYD